MMATTPLMRAAALATFALGLPGLALAQTVEQANSPALPSVKIDREVASGKYGSDTVSVSRTTALSASWDLGDYGLSVNLPYVDQTGPNRRIAVGAGRRLVFTNQSGSASGMGDVTVDATRFLLTQEDNGLDVDIGAVVKLPTASAAKFLGTGKTDYSLQFTAARPVGAIDMSITAGYTWVGKLEASGYRSIWYSSVDASTRFGKDTRIGVTYSASQSLVSGSPAPRDATLYVERRLAKRFAVAVFVSKGYSTQSADHAIGGSVSLNF